MTVTLLTILLLALGWESGAGERIIASDRGQAELATPQPVPAPITHQRQFRGERELFGYAPRYTPNVVTFGP